MQDFVQYLRYRLQELPVWLGIPVLGLFLAEKPIVWSRLIIFFFAISFSMLHVLLVNDWGDLQKNPYEKVNLPSKANQLHLIHCIGKTSIYSYIICIILFSLLGPISIFLALIGGMLSVLYSHPSIHFKENLLGSTGIHFIGGEIQFLLGYTTLGAPIKEGILVGAFFSFIFVAGHFVHMCLDVNEDKKGNIQTWATRFNNFSILLIASIVFLSAHIYLLMLTIYAIVPLSMFYIFILPLIVHIIFYKDLLRRNMTQRNIYRYRKNYRLVYALCTGAYILSTFY